MRLLRLRSAARILAAIAILATRGGAEIDRTVHPLAINQIGYSTEAPKRFTAPLSPDGTPFIIRLADSRDILHRGEIRNHIGDFTGFRPAESARHFVIEVRGGELKPAVSEPFLIRPDLLQEQYWQPAIDFLIDARSVTGTHPSAFGGCPWRDGNYYDAIIPSLVLLHLADPARIKAMPRQIDWAADKARVLDPTFEYDAKTPESGGVMEAVAKYYSELEPPSPDAPDVVKLIHWGAGFYLMKPATKDPMGDPEPRQIHAQTVEQVSYVLWAWPSLKQWLPQSFYDRCRDFCFANWEKSLAIDEKWWDPKSYDAPPEGNNPMAGRLHPYKGRHAPGHSIVPNLLMHEVAKREKRDDAAKYLTAATAQAAYLVERLDWNDPRSTKGHRMSEHWTIPKLNDVGSTVSFPAIATAASWVVRDPALKSRLQELAVCHIDIAFGRNPRLAAAPHLPQPGFPEIERGWPIGHKLDVCARLELCRGAISSGPGSEMFPFQPEAAFRHAEGWVNYGASWCTSLFYLEIDATATTPDL